MELNRLVSALHTNELLLRCLITSLDGRTLSKNRWMKSIDKLLDSGTELSINSSFARVSNGDPLISLSPEVVKDLSSD